MQTTAGRSHGSRCTAPRSRDNRMTWNAGCPTREIQLNLPRSNKDIQCQWKDRGLKQTDQHTFMRKYSDQLIIKRDGYANRICCENKYILLVISDFPSRSWNAAPEQLNKSFFLVRFSWSLRSPNRWNHTARNRCAPYAHTESCWVGVLSSPLCAIIFVSISKKPICIIRWSSFWRQNQLISKYELN